MIFGALPLGKSNGRGSFVARGAAMGLTPLADIVFLLVIFFMMATSFSKRETAEILFAPPQAQRGAEESLKLEVLGAGAFRLGGEDITRGLLYEALSLRSQDEKKAGISLEIHEKAQAQDLVDGFLFARRAAFNQISLSNYQKPPDDI